MKIGNTKISLLTWRKYPSVMSGGKRYFYRFGDHTIVWDRYDHLWHVEDCGSTGLDILARSFKNIKSAKKFVEAHYIMESCHG